MADILPGTQGQEDYRYLIDFVKAGQLSVRKEKKQNPVAQSSISGYEARSFYQELCEKNVNDEKVTSHNRKRTSDLDQAKRHRKKTQCSGRSSASKKKLHGYSGAHGVHSSKKVSVDYSYKSDSKSHIQKHIRDSQNKTIDRGCESLTKYSTSSGIRGTDSHVQLSQRVLDHRKSELLRLAQNGDGKGVKALLQVQQGVDVNCVDRFGWTASMAAAFEDHQDVLQILVEAGADLTVVNAQGQTALTLAQQKRHTSVVNFIESYLKFGFIASRSRVKVEKQPVVSFYCDVCKSQFSDTDQKAHATSVVHIFNTGSKPKDDSFLIPLSNAGFRMMMKTGWDGNTGLGPSGQGQKFPVKTLLKRDRKCLGSEVTDKAKVTHFKANDKAAISTVHDVGYKREENVRTLSRRAQRSKDKRDRRWEINLRRELS
ncbi:G patch domain and ankyrin repeat-containing protein 1 homolog [Littorina saxatilis]|uniref:G-patch domain-containing protein n=1 Tax=Littorina saxatilis TaxID=31220 RepID=A0AAN9GLX4_9CAEN